MYLAHWELESSPFRQLSSVRWFYHGPMQEEVLARLQFLVENRHPFGIVSGVSGSGKSLLLDVFASRLHQEHRDFIQIDLQGCDVREMWWRFSVGMKLNAPLGESRFRLWRRVSDRVSQYRFLNRDLVVLLDNVDQAEQDVTIGLTQLLALNRFPQGRLNVIAACCSENLMHLGPRLLEQVELKVEVGSLELQETREYLNACLAHVGCKESLFSNAAVQRLHDITQGIPRRINHLAELSLVAAASEKLPCVDTEIVEGVSRELEIPQIPQRIAA